jgi:hypothetical protein
MCSESRRKWVRQAWEVLELRRKCRELESIEILKAAASFFERECHLRHR